MHNITQANQIAIVLPKPAQCLLLARAVLRNPCRFLEKNAPFLGTAVQNIIEAILTDDAHAIVSNAGVCKKLINVLDPAACIIQIDFTVTVTVQTALNDNLLIVNRQGLISIIKDQYHLSDTQRAASGRSCKYNILRAEPPQRADILLAKHPADGVRNVAFSTAVRPHNSRDSLVEHDDDSLSE